MRPAPASSSARGVESWESIAPLCSPGSNRARLLPKSWRLRRASRRAIVKSTARSSTPSWTRPPTCSCAREFRRCCTRVTWWSASTIRQATWWPPRVACTCTRSPPSCRSSSCAATSRPSPRWESTRATSSTATTRFTAASTIRIRSPSCPSFTRASSSRGVAPRFTSRKPTRSSRGACRARPRAATGKA